MRPTGRQGRPAAQVASRPAGSQPGHPRPHPSPSSPGLADGQGSVPRPDPASNEGKLNITGRDAERPSPESSPLVAVSGGWAEAQRSRPERPALSKSAVGPARDCGPPGAGAPLEPHSLGVVLGYAAPLAWARGLVQGGY